MYTTASLLFPAKETFLTDGEAKDLHEEQQVNEVEVGVEEKSGSVG